MKLNTSNIIRCSLTAYILQRKVNLTNAIHCYLCEGDDASKIHSNLTSVIDGKSCSDLAADAFDFAFDDDRCAKHYQLLGHFSCDCEISPKNEDTQCSLCKNGDDINQNYANRLWFSQPSDSSITCQDAAEYAKRFDKTSDQCAQFQFAGSSKCGCNAQPQENSCTLCKGGEDPPFPSRIGYDELFLTCDQMARGAPVFHKDSDQCLETQFSGSLICGCPYVVPDEPMCSLCKYGDGVPESHLQKQYFPGHSDLTCEAMEITAAFDSLYGDVGKCIEAQVVADIFCGCQRTEEAPSSTPSIAPSSSPTSQFRINCSELSSGIVPDSIPNDATQDTIEIYSNLVLSNGYTVFSIQDDLLKALQNEVGPLISGCESNKTEVGNRYLNEDNDDISNILFVVFKKIEKEGEQEECPINQFCPIVKFTIDVAITNNNIEIYRRNRFLSQTQNPVGINSRRDNIETLSSLNSILRNSHRNVQSNQKPYEETVRKVLEEESGNLEVPGLLGMTVISDEKALSFLKDPELPPISEKKKFPVWAIILIVVSGFFALIAILVFSYKARNESSNGRKFIRSDEYFDESLSVSGSFDKSVDTHGNTLSKVSDYHSNRTIGSAEDTVAL